MNLCIGLNDFPKKWRKKMASRLKELSSVFPPHTGLFFIRHFQQTSFKWLFVILKSFLLFILKNYKKR